MDKVHISTYLEQIKQNCPNIDRSILDNLFGFLSITHLKIKDYYIERGEIQHQIGYVCSGLIRAYYIDERGNEKSVNFIKEGEYATHYPALKEGQPSKFYFQCLEPTVILNIPYTELLDQCVVSHTSEHYLRLLLEDVFAAHLRRLEGFLFDSAEKRYLDFVRENPDLFNRVSLSYLSSYLGIERQSLTRIRKKLLNEK